MNSANVGSTAPSASLLHVRRFQSLRDRWLSRWRLPNVPQLCCNLLVLSLRVLSCVVRQRLSAPAPILVSDVGRERALHALVKTTLAFHNDTLAMIRIHRGGPLPMYRD
jgi:hypothetical protein